MTNFLPSVIHAEYQGNFRIRVTFNDNTAKTLDFRAWLDGPVFQPLKDLAYFQRFFVEGGTVVWPNGADIAPETLYAAAPVEKTERVLKPGSTSRTRKPSASRR